MMVQETHSPSAAPVAAVPPESGLWREKLLPLLFWMATLCLLFRPLIWADAQRLLHPPAEGTAAATPWWNLLADLICFAICALTLANLILGRIGFIALNTFREAVRNRILYFILFFALILMAASGVVKQLAIAAHGRVVVDLGLTSISFFGLMAAVFVGISLVYNELDKKTIYTIVSKPVHRSQFLLGKFFGLLLTIYVIVGIMTLFFFAVLNYQHNTRDDVIYEINRSLYVQDEKGELVLDAEGSTQLKSHYQLRKIGMLGMEMARSGAQAVGNVFGFSSVAVHNNLLVAVAMICLELMIITALAVLFSSFSTPTLSAFFTVMLFLAGRSNEDIMRFAERVKMEAMRELGAASVADLPFTAIAKIRFAEICSLIVPNLDSINVSSQVIHADTVEVWRMSVLYAICYTGLILLLSMVVFGRRNFK